MCFMPDAGLCQELLKHLLVFHLKYLYVESKQDIWSSPSPGPSFVERVLLCLQDAFLD